MKMKPRQFALLSVITCFLLGNALGFAGDDDPNPAKAKETPKAEKEKQETSCQSNPFTRFWIHTVGAPMARGLKDGTRKVHKGLKVGARKIKHTFNGGSKEKVSSEEKNRATSNSDEAK